MDGIFQKHNNLNGGSLFVKMSSICWVVITDDVITEQPLDTLYT